MADNDAKPFWARHVVAARIEYNVAMTDNQAAMDVFTGAGEAEASARQFITFACAGQTFGIDIMSIREIRNWSRLTPMPASKPDVLGLMEIRGRVVAVHDLALRIGCTANRVTDQAGQVILILSVRGNDMGLLVDSVSDIVEAQEADMLPVPQMDASAARFLAGIARVGDELVAILDEQVVHDHAVDRTPVSTTAHADMTDDAAVEVAAPGEGGELVYVD
ncbi:chemotaxis protein CheW [Devosia sp. CAU 1758]